MFSFKFEKAKAPEEALVGTDNKKKFLAGGTTLIDLMKLEVESPEVVMDINSLPLKSIKEEDDGFKVDALVTNSELAHHKDIKKHFPVLSQALLSGATVQLRNKATTGGNLLQRTRCVYFRDTSKNCNKREPGTGCAAIEGFNRNLAILGTSEACIATNPSDMNVAMAALEAKVHLLKDGNERTIELKDFHLLPGKTPQKETVLEDNELITGVTIPKIPAGSKSLYLKLRDRASYEFALASIGIIAKVKGGRIERVRFAMGGIGTKPWRDEKVEKMLEGQIPSAENFSKAADAFLKDAKLYSENGFKKELAKRCLIKGLKMATESNA